MEIDLGSKAKANVVYEGKKYPIDIPSMQQIEDFLAELKKGKGSEHKVFRGFVVKLGLPDDNTRH